MKYTEICLILGIFSNYYVCYCLKNNCIILDIDEELRKIEILKLRVGNLLVQRQIISQALIVLIGGLAGICFM